MRKSRLLHLKPFLFEITKGGATFVLLLLILTLSVSCCPLDFKVGQVERVPIKESSDRLVKKSSLPDLVSLA